MDKNVELFEKEIEELKESYNVDSDTFKEILDCTRKAITEYGDTISPMAVVDIIDIATDMCTEYIGTDFSAEKAVETAIEKSDALATRNVFRDYARMNYDEYGDGNLGSDAIDEMFNSVDVSYDGQYEGYSDGKGNNMRM